MNDTDLIAYAAANTPSTDVKDIQAKARKMLELQAKVAAAQDVLKAATAALREVQEVELPEMMEGAGISTLKLKTGETITLVEDLKVSVPKANKAVVCSAMRAWGYEKAITNEFFVTLGKDSDVEAKALCEKAKELGVEGHVVENISTMTVKKALKERMKEGITDDFNTFGAFRWTHVKVK